MEVIEIGLPDDFHHHLRDHPTLANVLVHASSNFGRLVS
jgi:dihydroorotase